MRSYGLCALLLSSLGAMALAACSAGPEEGAASATSNVDTTASDLDLAKQAVAILQGANPDQQNGKCNACHTAGKDDIKRWGAAFTALDHACLDPSLSLTPMQRVDCLRKDPSNPASPFTPNKLGLYSGGAAGADFEALFKSAFPSDQWQQKFKDFKAKAGMPRGTTEPALTTAEFATLKTWAQRGLPRLDDVLPDLPGQADCRAARPPAAR